MRSESGSVPFNVPAGFKVDDLPLKMIERPERCSMVKGASAVDKDRLFSVIQAMIAGTPLPPIQVQATESGFLRVANGFHRYYASVILGYSEIPVLWIGEQKCSEQFGQASDDCSSSSSRAFVLEAQADDGRTICLEAVILAPKNRNGTTLASGRRRQAPKVPCRPRYEPPAVRRERERLLREEQERQERIVKAAAFRKKALSKEANDHVRCQQMRSAGVTYAEKAMGRTKAAAPPTWEGDPELH